MKKILILGCNDTAKALLEVLCTQRGIASEICLASRRKEDCNELKNSMGKTVIRIITAGIDVTNTEGSMMMVNIFGPEVIVNLMPADLSEHVMRLALKVKAAYIDGAILNIPLNPRPEDLLGEQFKYFMQFKSAGVTAVCGCGYNPGLLSVLVAAAGKEDFDSIDSVDFLDSTESEASDEGAADTVVKAKLYVEDLLPEEDESDEDSDAVAIPMGQADIVMSEGKIVSEPRAKIKRDKISYATVTDVAVAATAKELPDIQNIRCFKKHRAQKKRAAHKKPVRLIENLEEIGMLSDVPVKVGGAEIAPRDFLMAILPHMAAEEEVKPAEDFVPDKIVVTGKKGINTKSVEYSAEGLADCDTKVLIAAVKMVSSDKWNTPGVFTPAYFPQRTFLTAVEKEGLKFDVAPCEEIGK